MRFKVVWGGVTVTTVMGTGTVITAADFGAADRDEQDWNLAMQYLNKDGWDMTQEDPFTTLDDGRDLYLLTPREGLVQRVARERAAI